MGDDGHLRVADAERDATAGALREHYAAGRISSEELSGRLDAVYGATTRAELDALVGDLPRLPASRAQASAALGKRRADLRRRLVQQTGASLSPFAICVLIWGASGAQGAFWPVWLLIFPLMFLVRNGWALYGPAPDLDRVERELRRRSGHRHRHGRHRHELP